MSKNKFPKSVSFNLNNKVDVAILKYVSKRNFSGYVKKLILADMQKAGKEVAEIHPERPLSKFEQLQRKLESAKNVNSDSQDNTDTKSDS